MIPLKMTPAEAKAEGYGSPMEAKPPAYPWGTRLTLTDEVVRKLFPDGLPKVGAMIAIDAFAEVVTVNETKQQEGPDRVSVDLQLTEMDLEQDVEEKPTAAQAIYGKA